MNDDTFVNELTLSEWEAIKKWGFLAINPSIKIDVEKTLKKHCPHLRLTKTYPSIFSQTHI